MLAKALAQYYGAKLLIFDSHSFLGVRQYSCYLFLRADCKIPCHDFRSRLWPPLLLKYSDSYLVQVNLLFMNASIAICHVTTLLVFMVDLFRVELAGFLNLKAVMDILGWYGSNINIVKRLLFSLKCFRVGGCQMSSYFVTVGILALFLIF